MISSESVCTRPTSNETSRVNLVVMHFGTVVLHLFQKHENIYPYLSFLDIEMAQVVESFSRRRQGPFHFAYWISR